MISPVDTHVGALPARPASVSAEAVGVEDRVRPPLGPAPRMEPVAVGPAAVEEQAAPREEPEAAEAPASTRDEDEFDALRHPLVQDLMLEPSGWRIWPAVAILRWLQKKSGRVGRRLVYRSQPSLGFAGSEIHDVAVREGHLELTLNAAGLATACSPLPSADIARIIADRRNGGAIGAWLDGPGGLFMQVLEAMLEQSNAPFALVTGGHVDAFMLVADVVGRSAPLSAGENGALFETRRRVPEGAVGLAGLFVGPISASGLAGLFRAYTGLALRIEEFTGGEVLIARPARVGQPMGAMLGTQCRLPSAGVEIHVDGGSDPDAQKWAREPVRRRSLHLLASSYLGGSSVAVSVFLWLDPGNAPPATLTDSTAFGGLAVLGPADRRVRLPLRI